MAIVQEVRCDFCGEVLVGAKGVHKISKSHIEFSGFMRDWQAQPNSTWRDQTYISPPDKRLMAFCTDNGASCLQDYIDLKRSQQRIYREQQLRDGATAEHMERLETGGVNRAKPPYRGSPPPADFRGY